MAVDSGSTATVEIEPPRFSRIDPANITKLVREGDQKWLRDHGGIEGMLLVLETDAENGIQGDQADIDTRRKVFGSNIFSEYDSCENFFYIALEASKDPMIVVLFVCAVLSICCGIQRHGLLRGWQEGVTKLVAILVVIIVSSGGNFWPTSQCLKLSENSSCIPEIDVVRGNKWQRIPLCHVVVGDIVFLKPGDQVPADGLFIDGGTVHIDTLRNRQIARVEVIPHTNPFLSFGSTIVDGYAKMLVTAVGKNGKSHMIHLRGSLIDELKGLTSIVRNFGQVIAALTCMVFLLRFFTGKIYDSNGRRVSFGGETKFRDVFVVIVGIVATPIMISLTSSPEGLVLAVKMSIAYSMKRLMKAKILVREPSICHSVASVTTICVNKTGTLTMDTMEVAKFWQGLNPIEEVQHSSLNPYVLELLHQGIGLNTNQPPSRSSSCSPTNSTEKAIFEWAVKQLGMDLETLKRSCTILDIQPFDSTNKQSGVLISKNEDNTIHVHRKGAPEVIIPMCSHYYESSGDVKVLNSSSKGLFEHILEGMTENGLRCIAFAHRKTSIRDYFNFHHQQLTLLGLVGFSNSPRNGTKRALEDCYRAGINVKLITGDNRVTARIMATNCGILEPDYQPGEVIEGEEFRAFSSEERLQQIENIRVLARATPDDKLLVVRCLKERGHVVTFLGGGIGAAQALREANAGICFGTQGAEIAKACSSIVMLNKDFPLIIDIFRWGRGIYDSVQIYTQFLLSATFVALVIDFVMAVSAKEPPSFDVVPTVFERGKIPFPVFQLLWVKLVAGILAALALVIKEPSPSIMQRPPINLREPIMTAELRNNIYAQAIYQITIFLVIHFKGKLVFKVNAEEKDTLILTTYILCQAFNMFNARLFSKNIYAEIQKEKLFLCIIGLIVSVQLFVVEILNQFSGTARIGFGGWGICIAFAASSSIVTWFVRCIPALWNLIWTLLKLKFD